MWINPAYAIDGAEAADYIRSHPLATVVGGDPLIAAHLPVLIESDRDGVTSLVGHIPRVDPLSGPLTTGAQILTIFTGPAAYVSPAMYASDDRLPTYNFAAVHVSGTARPLGGDDELKAHLMDLIGFHESTQTPDRRELWRPHERSLTRMNELLPLIVGFRIQITSIEGKFKLSQDGPAADAHGVFEALRQSPRSGDRDVAAMMDQHSVAETGG